LDFFFANQVFLTFLLSQKLWFKQSDSSWKEAVKKVQVHVIDAFVEFRGWMDKKRLKKEGAENQHDLSTSSVTELTFVGTG